MAGHVRGRSRAVLFRGCSPELAAGPDGRLIGVGPAAAEAAGPDAEVIEVQSRALPGLADSHLHLHGLAQRRLTCDLTGSRSLEEALTRIRRHADRLPGSAWVVGRGWYNDLWPDPSFPGRDALDAAADGRPAIMTRKDGHSAWVNSAALAAAGVSRNTPDPPGGVIDRDQGGDPAGILREHAIDLIENAVPEPSPDDYDRGLLSALRDLARLGLTSVHSMDGPITFAALQRLHAVRRLPVRVTWNLPAADLAQAERIGIRSGWGDPWLRIWGVKAFLDGSLGSRTAEMLDGSGVTVLGQAELVELLERCARAELNVCLHAIGDGAVRRALDALEPLQGAWSSWRPRIEHVQCVAAADLPRFARIGVIASMQPIHAVSDRELADAEWGSRAAGAYAWGALERAGARLALGSDAPVESADPLLGLDAATSWRLKVGWHPELALDWTSALRAYTSGPAYAAGMERDLGRLRPGYWCDATLVEREAGRLRVTATVAGGRLSRRPRGSGR